MTTAAPEAVQKPVEQYERKVRELALYQCRCATGADLKTKVSRKDRSQQKAA